MASTTFTSLFLVSLSLGIVYAEVIHTRKCPAKSGAQSFCEIHEVKVDPCPAAAERKPCDFTRGKNYTLTVDFTPNFDAERVDNMLMLIGSAGDTQTWDKLEKDACKHTTCPLAAGTRSTYTYATDPHGSAPDTETKMVKWSLIKSGEFEKQCCFQMKVNYHS